MLYVLPAALLQLLDKSSQEGPCFAFCLVCLLYFVMWDHAMISVMGVAVVEMEVGSDWFLQGNLLFLPPPKPFVVVTLIIMQEQRAQDETNNRNKAN
jgi:hypothetical protein